MLAGQARPDGRAGADTAAEGQDGARREGDVSRALHPDRRPALEPVLRQGDGEAHTSQSHTSLWLIPLPSQALADPIVLETLMLPVRVVCGQDTLQMFERARQLVVDEKEDTAVPTRWVAVMRRCRRRLSMGMSSEWRCRIRRRNGGTSSRLGGVPELSTNIIHRVHTNSHR
jgi:hypothetical protein